MVRKVNPALLRELRVSPELAVVLGVNKCARGQCMKLLWQYLKKHKLNKGRIITPDEKLAAVFGGKKPIDMVKMAKLISAHLS